ncbi:uncharacterized protein TNCV_1463111 [Trichonephila clavipes]|uniref:Uncharacterized protein n=1 Tax=Trichonephila clavipes TaxID=2585209 RepID=A0A8X6SC35_TRICX|nr:uncharacterized protein TNCV_1463111 [Trichonephila clavipes]
MNHLRGRPTKPDLPGPISYVLSHSEIPSLHRAKMNMTSKNTPAYHWYVAKSHSLSLQYRRSRTLQTVLARFRSSHLRGMTFEQRIKSFFICHCSSSGLDCWGISLGQLFGDQDLGRDILMRKGQRKGVGFPAPRKFETITTTKNCNSLE